MKQVAVLGLGDFGTALARQLKENNVAVLAVDTSESKLEALRAEFDHLVVADITQASALEKLALSEMDAVVIATSSPMTASIIAALRLKEIGVKRIVAKAENQDHAKLLQAIGVNEVVNPDEDSAVHVATKISWTYTVEMVELSQTCGIMEFSPPQAVIGKNLRDSRLRESYNVEVLAIRQKPGAPLLAIPNPDTVITAQCTLVIFGEDPHLEILRHEAERRRP